MRRYTVGIALLVGCGSDGVVPDPDPDARIRPDAMEPMLPCPTLECAGDRTLRHCDTPASDPILTPCSAGCVDEPEPHCGTIVPTGVVSVTDLAQDPALLAILIDDATTIDTDTGEIVGVRAPGTGVIAGIGFDVRENVGVFRFARLTIDELADVTFVGANAVALVARGDIEVHVPLDLTGDCIGNAPGPGGFPGGTVSAPASGLGAGGGGIADGASLSGGGGGGHGAMGGAGGAVYPEDLPVVAGGAAGATWNDPEITVLRGGAGGGAGAGPDGGEGGGGGGAIQIVSNAEILIEGWFDGVSHSAGIGAGGCGGKQRRGVYGSGGGGGAGGAILLEAPNIDTGAIYTGYGVCGGGGAAGNETGPDADGTDGNSGGYGGYSYGGQGGRRYFKSATMLEGEDGSPAAPGGSGLRAAGGGGGVGRIRFNIVWDLYVPNGGNTSPGLMDAMTTTTQGFSEVE